MNVIVFGATGMIGRGALDAALADARIERVLSVARRGTGHEHPKLDELIISDFFDYSAVEEQLTGYGACLFCLGITAAGKSQAEYRRLTYDLTLAAAETLVRLNPGMTFCYVSGEGTDQTGESRQMWARVKGETENALSVLPFKAVYHFRPAYIQPQGEARSRIALYRALYAVLSPLYPLLRRLFPGHVTTTNEVGRALVEAGINGAPEQVLDSRAIRALAAWWRNPAPLRIPAPRLRTGRSSSAYEMCPRSTEWARSRCIRPACIPRRRLPRRGPDCHLDRRERSDCTDQCTLSAERGVVRLCGRGQSGCAAHGSNRPPLGRGGRGDRRAHGGRGGHPVPVRPDRAGGAGPLEPMSPSNKRARVPGPYRGAQRRGHDRCRPTIPVAGSAIPEPA